MSGATEYDVSRLETDSIDEIVASIVLKRWNPTKLGRYLGSAHPNSKAADVRMRFFETVVQPGDWLDELRRVLQFFWLPLESHEIYAIMECFARAYRLHNPACGRSVDELLALIYTTILLNVDLHHAGVTRKMTCERFIQNAREALDLDVSDAEYTRIYDTIAREELKCDDRFGSKLVPSSSNCVLF